MKEKKIVFWGAGEMCRNFLKVSTVMKPEYIVDSDMKKTGTNLLGIEIKSPENLLEEKAVFIVVISQYEKEIFTQLQSMGFCYGIDYMGITKLYKQPVSMNIVQKVLEEDCFQVSSYQSEIMQRMNSIEEYQTFVQKTSGGMLMEKRLAKIYYHMPGKMGSYRGYCEICECEQDFQVDFLWSENQEPAWRETLTCPKCYCNSRMRFVAGYLKQNYTGKQIYCYEAKTVLYKHLQSGMGSIVGSEYLGEGLAGGTIIDGIMHQDAMRLSFDDAMFDVMVSCDVFEHVSDYKMALREAWRCLAEGGELLVSIPVFKERYENIVRTLKDSEGKLSYLLPPVYHGNPLSSQGSLVFHEFGWQFLDDLKEAGFQEAWAIVYFSVSKGYMGELPVIFMARK